MMLLRMERCGSHKTVRYPTQPSLIQHLKGAKTVVGQWERNEGGAVSDSSYGGD